MRLVETIEAKKNVDDIALYMAGESQKSALRFIKNTLETYRLIEEFPDIGHTPLFQDIEHLLTYKIPGFPHHNIFYLREENIVRVTRVMDTRRDLENVPLS